jgi:hypothetical protein
MYTVPDTASVTVGNCKVLVSVYSPNQQVHAKQVAGWMSQLLDAARRYLGGRLPADNYAFLYYFKDPKNPNPSLVDWAGHWSIRPLPSITCLKCRQNG